MIKGVSTKVGVYLFHLMYNYLNNYLKMHYKLTKYNKSLTFCYFNFNPRYLKYIKN